jgi:hypothetical protein
MPTLNRTGELLALADAIGRIPYRMALAGGWIDQPFVSRLNPRPPGSMVVVGLEPVFRWMDRSGLATGTRKAAMKLWKGQLPDRAPDALVRALYEEENRGKSEPSGSQDMIGLIYPGVCRLDYDCRVHGGVFPSHIELCRDPAVCDWIERVVHVLPVAPRPPGYNPLGEQHLDPPVIARLGQTGRDCFAALLNRDLEALGRSMNDCMACWASLLPHVVRHPALEVDLEALLACYQRVYPGAMYSGCGGGYLYVASDTPVPGAFNVVVRR